MPTGSSSAAFTTSVAPKVRASSSFDATVSMAMMRPAPAISAPLIARQSDAAAADHGHRGTRLDGRGVDHRADARGNGAANQRRTVERHVGADLGECMFMHEHLFRERRQVQELVDRLVTRGKARRFAEVPRQFRLVAQHHPARQAVLAVAAERRQAGDDVVARFDVVHLRSHASTTPADSWPRTDGSG